MAAEPVDAPTLPPGLSVLRRLAEAIEPGPDEEWEGRFRGTGGNARGLGFHFRARLGFSGGVVTGKGRCLDLRKGDDGMAFEGSAGHGTADLLVWFEDPRYSRNPLSCTGRMAGDGGAIAGEFTLGCFEPSGCGCSGGSGTFEMRRVVA